MTTSVLDILIYVFDRYMLEDTSEVPERDDLARDLELMGFGSDSVERALDWLADLADVRLQSAEAPPRGVPSLRLYSGGELTRLSTESRGFLMYLERHDILSPLQREVVLDRLLAPGWRRHSGLSVVIRPATAVSGTTLPVRSGSGRSAAPSRLHLSSR